MRQVGLLLLAGAWLGLVGCLAPYTWSPGQTLSVEPEAASATDSLSLAAELLDRGEELAAVPHLQAYIQQHPEALMVQAHLAELLFRQQTNAESRRHFERFVQQAQFKTGPIYFHQIHAHTRLMELAARTGDDFAEELNRGIGLLLLVRKWKQNDDVKDAASEEQTLMKSLKALRAAAELRPESCRVWYYQGVVYRLLGQRGPADEAYRRAELASEHDLTRREFLELRELQMESP